MLISGLMDGWSARERWRREALLARLGLGRIVASEKRGAECISESGMEWMCDGVNAATRASPAPAMCASTIAGSPEPQTTRSGPKAAMRNKRRAGSAKIVGQVQTSDRDSQSKRGAESRDLGRLE